MIGSQRQRAAHLMHEASDKAHSTTFGFHLHESNASIRDRQESAACRDPQRHRDFSDTIGESVQIGVVDQLRNDNAKRGRFIEVNTQRFHDTNKFNH